MTVWLNFSGGTLLSGSAYPGGGAGRVGSGGEGRLGSLLPGPPFSRPPCGWMPLGEGRPVLGKRRGGGDDAKSCSSKEDPSRSPETRGLQQGADAVGPRSSAGARARCVTRAWCSPSLGCCEVRWRRVCWGRGHILHALFLPLLRGARARSAPPARAPRAGEATHRAPGRWGCRRAPRGQRRPGRPRAPRVRPRKCGVPSGSSPPGRWQPGHRGSAQRSWIPAFEPPGPFPQLPFPGSAPTLTVRGSVWGPTGWGGRVNRREAPRGKRPGTTRHQNRRGARS